MISRGVFERSNRQRNTRVKSQEKSCFRIHGIMPQIAPTDRIGRCLNYFVITLMVGVYEIYLHGIRMNKRLNCSRMGVRCIFFILNFQLKLAFLEVSPVLVRSVESRGFDVGTWRTIVRSRAEKQYVSPSLNFKPLLLYMQTLKILCSPLCHPSGLGCARLRYVPHNHLRASIFTDNF